jgi:KAP family P-loop domain
MAFAGINISIVRRWLYFFLISAVVAILGFYLVASRGKLSEWFYRIFGPVHWSMAYGAILLFIALLIASVLKMSPCKLGQFRSIHRYPPTWLAIFVATTIVCVMDQAGVIGPPGYRASVWEWTGLGGSALVLVTLSRWISPPSSDRPTMRSGSATGAQTTLPRDWSEIEQWVRTESPATDDLLNRRYIARRIARHLLTPFGEDRTIGLIGAFGTGKTSIVQWVEKELKLLPRNNCPKVWVCSVTCWGFVDSSAAIQNILASAISAVSRHADCFSVRQVPESYRKTLSAGGGWLPPAIDVFVGQPDPTDHLRTLTPLLEAINARLVIVIEDLDRNQSVKFDIQDVLALLQRLKLVRGLSFILTGSSSSMSRMDFAKLCDHIEALPAMEEKDVLRLITIVREHCLTAYDDVNPVTMYGRGRGKTELWDHAWSRAGLYFTLGYDIIPTGRAVTLLSSTPRALKHALSHTIVDWQRLHGELDFDELLIANVLRHGAPEAFDFLLRRIDILRSEQARVTDAHDRQLLARPREAMRREWRLATKSVEWDARAAMQLITFLVPNATQYLRDRQPYTQQSPQGVRHNSPTDYWRRLLAGELMPGELTDQEVLHAMEQWLTVPTMDQALVQRLSCEESFADVWLHFSERVPDGKVLDLADQVFAVVREKKGAEAAADHRGLRALRRRLDGYDAGQGVSIDWLQAKICATLKWSLQLCAELYCDWPSVVSPAVRAEGRDRIRETIVSAAKEQFVASNPRALLGVLSEKHTYSLRWFVFPPDNQCRPSRLREPSDWRWFGAVLLAAAKADQTKMLPQIAHLIGDSEDSTGDRASVTIRRERVTGIFGADAEELMCLLSRGLAAAPESNADFLRIVSDQASQWHSDEPRAGLDG